MAASSSLRRDLSQRNLDRASRFGHELSYGAVPSIIYQEENNSHGNFLDASYRSICANPDWRKRLDKSYTGGRWIPRRWDRTGRRELDCANSSDALLMNIFCYPRVLCRPELCALLGIEQGTIPEFGFKPRIPFMKGGLDRTEVDMRLETLLVEAKLTETGFRPAASHLLMRYRDFPEVFDTAELPAKEDQIGEYQLLRGILAAYSTGGHFALLCDSRRADLRESWFRAVKAVRSYSFRSRLKLLTWQEIATLLPPRLRSFLDEKYGIVPA
jgi:hypothetical protein